MGKPMPQTPNTDHRALERFLFFSDAVCVWWVYVDSDGGEVAAASAKGVGRISESTITGGRDGVPSYI
jgi:hypothetical protein